MTKYWGAVLADMPKLTPAQIGAVTEILDYHLTGLLLDHPPVDDALWRIQHDLEDLKKETP